MALNLVAAIAQIRAIVAAVTGMAHVYALSENDANALPAQINEFPAALVVLGDGDGYILSPGQHRHNYLVKILVVDDGADVGFRAYAVAPFLDRILEAFVGNVTLGNRVNSCVVEGHSGIPSTVGYGDMDYTGFEVRLAVSEQAAATPAVGS